MMCIPLFHRGVIQIDNVDINGAITINGIDVKLLSRSERYTETYTHDILHHIKTGVIWIAKLRLKLIGSWLSEYSGRFRSFDWLTAEFGNHCLKCRDIFSITDYVYNKCVISTLISPFHWVYSDAALKVSSMVVKEMHWSQSRSS